MCFIVFNFRFPGGAAERAGIVKDDIIIKVLSAKEFMFLYFVFFFSLARTIMFVAVACKFVGSVRALLIVH